MWAGQVASTDVKEPNSIPSIIYDYSSWMKHQNEFPEHVVDNGSYYRSGSFLFFFGVVNKAAAGTSGWNPSSSNARVYAPHIKFPLFY